MASQPVGVNGAARQRLCEGCAAGLRTRLAGRPGFKGGGRTRSHRAATHFSSCTARSSARGSSAARPPGWRRPTWCAPPSSSCPPRRNDELVHASVEVLVEARRQVVLYHREHDRYDRDRNLGGDGDSEERPRGDEHDHHGDGRRVDARDVVEELEQRRLNGRRRGNGRLWRRLARAPEAVAGRLVGRPLDLGVSSRPEPPSSY
eukprot:scaffold21580_cov65-Phaeocystis_antarctica.AAC.7